MSSSPARRRAAGLLSGPAARPIGEALLRLHASLTFREAWAHLRAIASEGLGATSSSLEVGGGAGQPKKVFRESRWQPAAPQAGPPAEGGTRRSRRLSIVALRDGETGAALRLLRDPSRPHFSTGERRLAEAVRVHFEVAVRRILAHEEEIYRGVQFAAVLENAPVGILLLDWNLKPLWHNCEAANACAVWNYGERRAAALNLRRALRVPAPLARACAELRAEWLACGAGGRESLTKPRAVGDGIGLHAQIVLSAKGERAPLHPAFQIRLDYRRPRGDRNRPLSPGAVALLDRLTAREREVAMRLREGLRTTEIAAELGRSPLTVKTQLQSIFRKLEVRGRSRAAALLNR